MKNIELEFDKHSLILRYTRENLDHLITLVETAIRNEKSQIATQATIWHSNQITGLSIIGIEEDSNPYLELQGHVLKLYIETDVLNHVLERLKTSKELHSFYPTEVSELDFKTTRINKVISLYFIME